MRYGIYAIVTACIAIFTILALKAAILIQMDSAWLYFRITCGYILFLLIYVICEICEEKKDAD